MVSYSKVVEELKDELLSVLGLLHTMETTGRVCMKSLPQ